MAHEIFAKSFAARRTPAWHSLGTVFTEPQAPSEALIAIGAGYTIVKMPAYVSIDNGDGTSTLTPLPQVALMREPVAADPEWRNVGIVSNDYEVVSNVTIAKHLDPLAERWPLETIGALGHGERFFCTLSLGEWDVAGEQMNEFFLVSNGNDGKTSLTLAYTPVRVVCQNTLSMGLKRARVNASITHRKGAGDEMQFRLQLLKDLQNAKLAGREAFNTLSELALTAGDVSELLTRLFPTPKPSRRMVLAEAAGASAVSEGFRSLMEQAQQRHDQSAKYALMDRAAVAELVVKHNDEFPRTANTAWGFYNAAAEWLDFGRALRKGSAESAVFGARAGEKEHAFALAISATPAPAVKPTVAAKRSSTPKRGK